MSSRKPGQIAAIGIDIGKNFSHVVGLDKRDAIILRQKWPRGQVEACLIGMEACVCGPIPPENNCITASRSAATTATVGKRPGWR
jgi:hypothetical protein